MSRKPGISVMIVAPPWLPVPPPGYGGTESLVAILARGLAERGYDVSVAAIATSMAVDGVRLLPTLPDQPPVIGASASEWQHVLGVLQHIARERPDVVIDHSGPLGGLLIHGTGPSSLHVAHGRLDGGDGAAYAEVARRHPGLRLVAISQSQQALAPGLPFAGICHNGVVVEESPFAPEGRGYLVFVGRMTPDKGPDTAIEIARAAGRPLVIAAKCEEPAEQRYFEREIAPRLDHGTHWVGEVDSTLASRLMASADALLFPIRWPEPFGMVMVEAMACGTPVLATNHGAVAEVVEDGVTGFVRDDPLELVDCVDRLPDIDRHACRRHVEANFSHRQVAGAYERLMREVLHA